MWINWSTKHQALGVSKDAPWFVFKFAAAFVLCQALWMAFIYWLNGGTVKSIGYQIDEKMEREEIEE